MGNPDDGPTLLQNKGRALVIRLRMKMGIDYYYLNRDKTQYFSCGLFHRSGRFRAIGSPPGGRALALLLEERGRWANDRIAVISDRSTDWEVAYSTGIDIELDVKLMLFEVDGLEWLFDELDHPLIFPELCAIALLLRRQNVVAALERKFGIHKWEERYREHLKRNSDYWSQGIVNANARGILRLRT